MLTNTTLETILPSVLGATTTYYVGLCTTLPDCDGAGTVELTDAAYAREAHGAWETVSGSATTPSYRANTGAIEFAPLAADALDVLGFAIWDMATGGSVIAFGVFRDPVTADPIVQDYLAGDVPRFLDNGLRVS